MLFIIIYLLFELNWFSFLILLILLYLHNLSFNKMGKISALYFTSGRILIFYTFFYQSAFTDSELIFLLQHLIILILVLLNVFKSFNFHFSSNFVNFIRLFKFFLFILNLLFLFFKLKQIFFVFKFLILFVSFF